MAFEPDQRKNSTVVILGAGASYGSSLKTRPPVMNNFIRDGRKRVKNKYYDVLWDFLDSIGYPLDVLLSGSPNLEEIYSVLHVISSGLWNKNESEYLSTVGKEFWKIPPVYFLASFIMEVTNRPSVEACKKSCCYHDAIVNELCRGDTIISFNYDLIADASVKQNKNWSEYNGYGFPCYDQEYFKEADEESLLDVRSEITLLKPHGSLNWWTIPVTHMTNDKGITLPSGTLRSKLVGADVQSQIHITPLKKITKQAHQRLPIDTARYYDELAQKLSDDDLWMYKGVMRPNDSSFIIPPSLYKFGDPTIPEELINVWNKMFKAISLAGKIVCIGYSFPPNDSEFSTLFRLALKNNERKGLKILIVDPKSEVRERVQSLVPDRNVLHVTDTLENYVKRGG
jgi:hypothetical protein